MYNSSKIESGLLLLAIFIELQGRHLRFDSCSVLFNHQVWCGHVDRIYYRHCLLMLYLCRDTYYLVVGYQLERHKPSK